jgi:hypothetical protein
VQHAASSIVIFCINLIPRFQRMGNPQPLLEVVHSTFPERL